MEKKPRDIFSHFVLRDEVIRFTGPTMKKKCPYPLRIVENYDADKERTFVYLTNNFKLAASTISRIYKERWQIDSYFKALKQHIKIKTFVGTSFSAVKIQVWTALIAILLLKYLQIKSAFGWLLSNLTALLGMNLFTYRDLWEWINKPFETLPVYVKSIQMDLKFLYRMATNLDSCIAKCILCQIKEKLETAYILQAIQLVSKSTLKIHSLAIL
ncbi:MAG: transposase [Bacteroidota bacterium]